MSPILDLQRRVTEVGRIRMGTSKPRAGGGKTAQRLETWRLTSPDKTRIDAAAEALGGKPKPWTEKPGHWDLITTTDRLSVILIPGQNLSQWWELWGPPRAKSANVCLRRCDGRQIVGGFELGAAETRPCACPQPYDERRELAQKGKACKPYTRFAVILRDVPGFGCWRLETAGINAALELAGAAPLLERVTAGGELVPAFLRIDWRTMQVAKPDGSTEGRKFPVPVLDIAERIDTIARLAGGTQPAQLERGDDAQAYTPVPPPTRVSVSEGLEAAARGALPAATSARAAAPIGPGAAAPSPATEAPPVEAQPVDEPDFEGDAVPAPVRLVPLPEAAAIPAERERTAPDVLPPEPSAPTGSTGTTGAAPAGPTINERQRTRLWTIASGRGVPEDDLRRIVREITGDESTKTIPIALYEAVVATVEAHPVDPEATP